MRCPRVLSALLALLALGSCVIVPYPTSAELSVSAAPVPAAEFTLVSIGRRAELEQAYRELLERSERLESLLALEVRDAAFPEGGWSLAELLDTASVARLAPLELDLLVLLEPRRDVTLSSWGEFTFYLGFYGLQSDRLRTTYAAWLYDPRRGRLLERVEASSTGSTFFIGLFYALFVVPLTEWSAADEFFDELVERLERSATGPRARFAVLALESPPAELRDAPAPTGPGAPPRAAEAERGFR